MTNFDEVSALEYKKAIILYGPPGTSKSYEAEEIAKRVIREKDFDYSGYINGIDNNEKTISERIHKLQLHPNYTYEDFIWGYQIENNKTVAKKGYFLGLLDTINSTKGTHFLILDEINRVDLSRLFGELFSAIENRGKKVNLPVEVEKTKEIIVPENLYIIGTMNEIDFSLERVDFALRRRFIWFFYGYNESKLRDIINGHLSDWDPYISTFVKCCNELNKAIDNDENLGPQYEIGHTIFAELATIKKNSGIQWKTAKKVLWTFSIKPMLEAFLGNLEDSVKKDLLKEDKDPNKQGTLYKAFFGTVNNEYFDEHEEEQINENE